MSWIFLWWIHYILLRKVSFTIRSYSLSHYAGSIYHISKVFYVFNICAAVSRIFWKGVYTSYKICASCCRVYKKYMCKILIFVYFCYLCCYFTVYSNCLGKVLLGSYYTHSFLLCAQNIIKNWQNLQQGTPFPEFAFVGVSIHKYKQQKKLSNVETLTTY